MTFIYSLDYTLMGSMGDNTMDLQVLVSCHSFEKFKTSSGKRIMIASNEHRCPD